MGSNLQLLGVVFLLHLCSGSSSSFIDPFRPSEEAHDYVRFADVKRQCQSVLSSAGELTGNSYIASIVKHELSFEKGDWRQDAGQAPLAPFDGRDVAKHRARRLLDPLQLATFMVTHVDGHGRGAGNAVNVSGVLILTISRKDTGPETRPEYISPEFKLSPGSTKLCITFEGVYTEKGKGDSDGDGDGERVLCMVGRAVLPTRSADGSDPWDWTKNPGSTSFMPPATADDSIVLVLRYPKKHTLSTRAVLGEMRSTRAASDAAFFDTVQLVSRLNSNICRYMFRRPGKLNAGAACSPRDDDGRALYKGTSEFCRALERYSYGRVMAVRSRRHCNSTATGAAPCRTLGPFEMDSAEDADRVVMRELQCERQYGTGGMAGPVMMSVVFQAMSPREDWYTAMQRSEVSGKTLSAEGVWNASTGRACMVACRGIGNKACHFRVCPHITTTFSITDRAIMAGRITSTNAAGGGGAVDTSFQLAMYPPRLLLYSGERLPLTYNYTKVEQAGEFLRRSTSPFDFRKIIAKSLPLSYPKCDDDDVGNGEKGLAQLVDSLALRFTSMPDLFPPEWIERPVLHLEIFFLGQFIERSVQRSRDPSSQGSRVPSQEPCPPRQLLLNVSAELTIVDVSKHRVTSSVMSLEGVYNPEDGRMHLIGCRDVRLPWGSSTSTRGDLGLEEGMDCSIEVKVEYPPTTAHWFVRSTAKAQIASTRVAGGGDPLHFSTVKLRAMPFAYPQQWPDSLSRGIINGVLCVVLLTATIVAALDQLRHLKLYGDVAPYVSLAMLGVQALGLTMPLVTGIEALLARVTLLPDAATAPSSSTPSDELNYYSALYRAIQPTAKVLTLAAFVLTLRLGQKVRRSRARMVARSPDEPGRVPSDGKVVVYHCGVQLVLFLLVLAVNGEAMTVEQHVALMQDLFLLPQVIGSALWRVNCVPLTESFYVGGTAVRLLPLVLTPVANVYSDQYELATRSMAGDVVIPLAAVALAVAVYVQQRWNYMIVSRMGKSEQKKLQHIF